MFKNLFIFNKKTPTILKAVNFSDSRYLDIIEVAHKAGDILLKYYERGNSVISIENKSDDVFDFVTKADKESDKFICSEISKIFPNDRIISEESFTDDSVFNGNTWFVDPLDGTKEFMFEGGRFSVMIGLCVDGVPVFGVVYNPLEEIIYVAEKGYGAFRKLPGSDWEKLKVSNVNKLEKSTQIIRKLYDEKRDSDLFIDSLNSKNNIQDASFGLRIARIVCAQAEFTIGTNRRASKWDICAPQLILEESGGIVTDIFGLPISYLSSGVRLSNSFIASNNKFHKQLVSKCKRLAILWGIISDKNKN